MAILARGRTKRAYLGGIVAAPENRDETATPTLGPALMGAWFGMVSGLIELLIQVATRAITGEITQETLNTNHHYGWMIPACNLLVLGSAGLGIGLLGRAVNRPRFSRACSYLLCYLTAYSLALSIPKVHGFATTVLAMGVSWRVASWIEAHRRRFRWVVTRTYPILAAALVGLLLVQFTVVRGSERRAIANLPASAPGSPNVLLIVLDTVRADATSAYGASRDTTPNLARLAERAVRFDQARTTAPWTLPAHASLFTGRWPHELTANVGRPLDGSDPTLAEFLAARGYASAAFVANTHNGNSWYGLGRGFARYEDLYENTTISPAEILRSSRLGRKILWSRTGRRLIGMMTEIPKYTYRKTAAMINRDCLTWLSAREGRPFFVFLNYYDAHDPYTPPAGAPRKFAQAAGGKPRSALEAARDDYDDCLTYLDDQVGRLLADLERRGLLKNTLVIVTSDHGEGFGEHGLSGHGISLYRPELHVPLLVAMPGKVPQGRSVRGPVSLRDVPATIADILAPRGKSPFPGRSLARHWGESSEAKGTPFDPLLTVVDRSAKVSPLLTNAPARLGRMFSLVADGWVLIRNGDGREELYDFEADPGELRDLARSPVAKDDLERLRGMLRTFAGPR